VPVAREAPRRGEETIMMKKTARKSANRAAKGATKKAATRSGSRVEKGDGEAAPKMIDRRIAELGDWRGKTLEKARRIITKADPEIVEEWKWVKVNSPGTPVWSHDGIICTGETYKNVVKLTFAKGASLNDPSGLFNSSLEGNVRRAIDIHEGEAIDEAALMKLIRAAVALNTTSKRG
jgi:hypothetical protein